MKEPVIESLAELELQYKHRNPPVEKLIIRTSLDAYTHGSRLFNADTIGMQEQFIIIYMNRSNQIIGSLCAFTGGITSTIVDLRIIYSVALKILATGIVVYHNHPSGNLKPSNHDIDLTNKIRKTGELFDITVFDHLILSPSQEYFSFADEGLL